MTRDNAEIVRRGFEAWDAGDDDALPTYFSPDVEIDASDRILNPAVYRGLDGAHRFRSEISENWGGFSVEIEELLVSGDRVVAFVRVSGQGRASGAAVRRPLRLARARGQGQGDPATPLPGSLGGSRSRIRLNLAR
jgi:ketosteroid isomerase-like protein